MLCKREGRVGRGQGWEGARRERRERVKGRERCVEGERKMKREMERE